MATTLGLDQPFRYRGYVYDTETGWYYLQSRYYSPETCRFISADVLLSTGQGVLGHNSFAYCGNNPIVRVDSAGRFFFTVIGAVVGGIVGGISAAINGEDVVAGAVGGAVSGAITGAVTDITVASGGAAAPLLVIAFGAVSGAVGDTTTQMVTSIREGQSFGDSFRSVDWVSVGVSAACGAVAGLISMNLGKAINDMIFEPAKKAFVDHAVQLANNNIAPSVSANFLINAATKSGLMQIAADALVCGYQAALYRITNNMVQRVFEG